MEHDTWIPNNNKSVLSVDTNNGETATVGVNGVTEIIYHTPCGDGDRHFVDICFDETQSVVVRCFNIDSITWKEDARYGLGRNRK